MGLWGWTEGGRGHTETQSYSGLFGRHIKSRSGLSKGEVVKRWALVRRGHL